MSRLTRAIRFDYTKHLLKKREPYSYESAQYWHSHNLDLDHIKPLVFDNKLLGFDFTHDLTVTIKHDLRLTNLPISKPVFDYWRDHEISHAGYAGFLNQYSRLNFHNSLYAKFEHDDNKVTVSLFLEENKLAHSVSWFVDQDAAGEIATSLAYQSADYIKQVKTLPLRFHRMTLLAHLGDYFLARADLPPSSEFNLLELAAMLAGHGIDWLRIKDPLKW